MCNGKKWRECCSEMGAGTARCMPGLPCAYLRREGMRMRLVAFGGDARIPAEVVGDGVPAEAMVVAGGIGVSVVYHRIQGHLEGNIDLSPVACKLA